MNRDEITAKIAELEKKIQMDKLQNAGADDAGKVTGRTQSGDIADSYALCLGGGGGKGAYQLGVYRARHLSHLWTRLQPYQELP